MKSLRLVILSLLALFAIAPANAEKKLTGTAVYYGDDTDTPADAKRKALEMARINALAREFGTVLTQTTIQRDENANGSESNYFASLSASEVKGEWLGDVGEPKFTVELSSDGLYVVKCTVTINAKQLSNKAPEFYAMPLRNGFTEKFESTDFSNGDEMYLKFMAPVNGYIAAYLVCDKEVATLLPYLSSTSGKCAIRANRDYVFFSEAKGETIFGTPDEYILQTDKPVEHNELYVLFSPNEFSKALDSDNGENLPRVQSYEKFSKWLAKLRRADDEMGVKKFNIVITNKQ